MGLFIYSNSSLNLLFFQHSFIYFDSSLNLHLFGIYVCIWIFIKLTLSWCLFIYLDSSIMSTSQHIPTQAELHALLRTVIFWTDNNGLLSEGMMVKVPFPVQVITVFGSLWPVK